MRIPSELLLYMIFSSENILSTLIDTTESMWDITDKNVHRLYGVIERSCSSYFGNNIYSSLDDKVAAIMYIIAKNHDFENGNKRTAIVAALTVLILNNYFLNIEPEELYSLVIGIVGSEPSDKQCVISEISSIIQNNKSPISQPFNDRLLSNISVEI